MKTFGITLIVAGLGLGLLIVTGSGGKGGGKPTGGETPPAAEKAKPRTGAPAETVTKIVRTDAAWQKLLTAEQYRVLRQKGTEIAFTGAYWKNLEHGTYRCAACGLELFRSDEKFDSGTGWPSFWAPADPAHVAGEADTAFGWVRDEVLCARCGGHLGHVFDDGPKPTGLRYCINSASLAFEKRK